MKQENVFYVIVSVFFLIIFLFLFLFFIYFLFQITNLENSMFYAIENPVACEQTGMCCFINHLIPFPSIQMNQYQTETAKWLAQQISYLSWFQSNGIQFFSSCKLIAQFQPKGKDSNAPLFGVALQNGNTCFVLYRGTITSQEWAYDFKYMQLPTMKQCHLKNCDEKCKKESVFQQIEIHAGFLNMFYSMEKDLNDFFESILKDESITQIIVAGHSLGAAMASLTGFFYSMLPQKKPLEIYTFGKPRVGNQCYQYYMNEQYKNGFFRLENENDLVPDLPLSVSPNLIQIDKPYDYIHEGTIQQFNVQMNSFILNHGLNTYIKFMP